MKMKIANTRGGDQNMQGSGFLPKNILRSANSPASEERSIAVEIHTCTGN